MSVVTSILIHNHQILLILRDNKPEIHEPNTWQLPGGGVEPGEDHLQAIQRELQEEISIIPADLRYLGSAPNDTAVFFACLYDEEVKEIRLGNEGQQLAFFAFEAALKQNVTAKLRRYLETYHDGVSELIRTGSLDDVSKLGLIE